MRVLEPEQPMKIMPSRRWLMLALAFVSALAPAASAEAQQLTLERALSLALESNRDLEISRFGLEEARGRIREAWSSVFPNLELSTSYTRNLTVPGQFIQRQFFDPNADPDELMEIKFGADNLWALQLRAEQPLFDAAVFIGVGAADRYHAFQAEAVRGRAQEVATRVRVSYYDVLLARAALRVSENSVQRIRKTLEEARALERAGLGSSYDVLRLEVELANVEPNLRRARNGMAAARRALGIELGLENADSLEVAGSLDSTELEEAPRDVALAGAGGAAGAGELPPEEVVQLALERRSDLRQLELMEKLRQTEVRYERSQYLPKVSLFGVYTINSQQNGDPAFFGGPGGQRSYGRQLGVQATVPIFAGLRRPAVLEQKEAVLRQARTQYGLGRARAEGEVRTLLDQVSEAKQRAAAQKLAVSQAQRGFAIVSAQHREGTSSQLEVTDAENALRQSEFNHAEAIYDYLVARARLDAATGTVPLVDTDRKLALER